MKIRNNIRLSLSIMAGDIVSINAGFLFLYYIRFYSGLFPINSGIPHVGEYIKILPIITVILIFLMRSEKLYSVRSRLSIVDEIFRVMQATSLGILIFMSFTFVYREFSYSRLILFLSFAVLPIFIGTWRFIMNRIMFAARKLSGKQESLVLIGDGPMIERLINHISDDPHWDYNVTGVIRIKSKAHVKAKDVPLLGAIDNFSQILDSNDVDEVIVTDLDVERSKMMEIVLECEKRLIEFRLVADLLGMMTSEVDMRTIDGVPLLGLKETPLAESYNRFLKRATDIVFSLIGIIITLPFCAPLALIIKLSSPGPVFYLQKRVGEDGKRFTIIKFRTMIDKAEKGVGRIWASANDSRRTKLGVFLRRTNLDELPQLINVLRGDMSLVGPRPERPHFVVKFKESIPRYMSRHKIKSGMTGWAQVNGLRGNTSIAERTKYDIYYIENWSLTFDIRIMFMSLFAIKNAY